MTANSCHTDKFVILSFRKKAKYPLVKPHFAVKKNTQAMQILFYDKTKINLILTHAFDFKKHLNFKVLKNFEISHQNVNLKNKKFLRKKGLSTS